MKSVSDVKSRTGGLRKVSTGSEEPTPLPLVPMGCMIAIQMNEALMINVLFPFLVFMIEFFGFTGSALGFHAGILASSFCAAQFLSSMLWGKLADRIGLKPCLISGTLGSSLMFFQFGLSQNFGQAVAARAFAGILNGNSGLLKCYIAKVTDQTNRAKGFSFISLAWGNHPTCVFDIACAPIRSYKK